jgi:hypothetical protein
MLIIWKREVVLCWRRYVNSNKRYTNKKQPLLVILLRPTGKWFQAAAEVLCVKYNGFWHIEHANGAKALCTRWSNTYAILPGHWCVVAQSDKPEHLHLKDARDT